MGHNEMLTSRNLLFSFPAERIDVILLINGVGEQTRVIVLEKKT